MGDLGDEKRAGGIRDITTHTHDESASQEHRIWVAGFRQCLDNGADDHEHAANRSTRAAAKNIGDVRSKEQNSKASKAWKGS